MESHMSRAQQLSNRAGFRLTRDDLKGRRSGAEYTQVLNTDIHGDPHNFITTQSNTLPESQDSKDETASTPVRTQGAIVPAATTPTTENPLEAASTETHYLIIEWQKGTPVGLHTSESNDDIGPCVLEATKNRFAEWESNRFTKRMFGWGVDTQPKGRRQDYVNR